ncbi:transposase [bacterium]|nr:transposase [candidate division CSSED10-310 bacterium]
MRQKRFKVLGRDAYYHLVNRINGPRKRLLFTNKDKQVGIQFVQKIAPLYSIEILSVCWMGNHLHLVVYVPPEPPSPIEAARKYNEYYKNRIPDHRLLNPEQDLERCRKIAGNMIDISHFMKLVLQSYSIWFNKTHHREGPLWKDRFKSTVLEESDALWECLKYVELNPVRAKITQNPGKYQFSSWGIYSSTGVHPFHSSFIRHIRSYGQKGTKELDVPDESLLNLFKTDIEDTITRELGMESKVSDTPYHSTSKNQGIGIPGSFVQCLKQVKLWSNGCAIGTARFVTEIANQFQTPEQVRKKRKINWFLPSGFSLTCYHAGR